MPARTRRCLAAVSLSAAVLSVSCGGGAADARATPSDPPTVGLLRVVPDEDHAAFVDELRNRGWAVGRDVELRPEDPGTLYADVEAAGAVLAEWQRADLDLLVAFSTPFAHLVAEQAPDVPALFLVNDPVASGLVTNAAAPEGQLTGVTFRTPADRTIDLTLRLLGGATTLGYLWPTDDPAVPGHQTAVREAAADLGVELVEASFAGPEEVPAAVAALADADVSAVLLATATATFRSLEALEQSLDAAGLPTVANTDFAEFAVLVVTPDGTELRRQLARQAARLLSGAEVAAVPVEDPRKFVVIVNRTKADELGLPPLSPEVLRIADVVR